MSAFQSIIDLRLAVSDLVGNRGISDVFPRLIRQAEASLNQKLRTVWQVTDDTLTFANGEADLPADFLEMIHVYSPLGHQMMAGSRADSRRPGTSLSTYSIGPGKIYVRGFSGDKDVEYYAALPSLTASPTATNWLLERFSNTYLYAVGLEAAKFLRDAEQVAVIAALLLAELKSIAIDDERARWSNSIVRVQGFTP